MNIDIINNTTKANVSHFAIVNDTPEIAPNPNMAATIANARKNTAHPIREYPFLFFILEVTNAVALLYFTCNKAYNCQLSLSKFLYKPNKTMFN